MADTPLSVHDEGPGDVFDPAKAAQDLLQYLAGGPIGLFLSFISNAFGFNIFDFFGGGHAGSSGAFRDRYFQTIAKIAPVEDRFSQQAAEIIADPTKNANLVASTYLNFVNLIIQQEDQGFEQFKGRNLLGQTMFFGRTYGWLFEHLASHVVFFSIDFTTAVRNYVLARITGFGDDISTLKLGFQNLTTSVNSILAKIADLQSFKDLVNTHTLQLQQITTRDIPTIYKNLQAHGDYIANIQVPFNIQIQARVVKLEHQVFDVFGPQFTDLQRRFGRVETQVFRVLTPSVTGLVTDVNKINTYISSSLTPQLKTLTDKLNRTYIYTTGFLTQQALDTIKKIEKTNLYINGTVVPYIDQTRAGLAATQRYVYGTLTPLVNKSLQDSALALKQISQVDIPAVNQGLKDLHNLQVLEIPKIWDNVHGAQRDITALSKPLSVQQTLASLSKRITADEQLKTGTILPAIQQLQGIVQRLQSQISQGILPSLANLLQSVGQILDQIARDITPRLHDLTVQVTNLSTVLNQLITNQITLFQVFIANIKTTVLNIVTTNCEEIRKCLDAGKKKDPRLACEEGKTWWGTWAECWYHEHTELPHFIVQGSQHEQE